MAIFNFAEINTALERRNNLRASASMQQSVYETIEAQVCILKSSEKT